MVTDQNIVQIFADLDSLQADNVVRHFAQAGSFRLCNLPAVEGKEAIHGFLDSFFQSISGMKHVIERTQTGDNGRTYVEVGCTFFRKDGSAVEAPACVVFDRGEEGIGEYRVYGDFSAL
ncbi:MAG: nuclear transport factor 2 family protein [Sphingobium sp.]|nr:nuclear transport factor 2 family protein [Sphingobium sp.]